MGVLIVSFRDDLPTNQLGTSNDIDGPWGCSHTRLLMRLTGMFTSGMGWRCLLHLDRKQARRTGMAGPLGEMFDHGAQSCSGILADAEHRFRLRRSEYHSNCYLPYDLRIQSDVSR